VLLQVEIAPVMNAMTPLMEVGDASFASSEVKRSMPPVCSSTATSTLTPQTISTIVQGTRANASSSVRFPSTRVPER